MSEQSPPPPGPAPEPIPSPAQAQPPAKKKKNRRTWKQRLKLTAIVILILALSLRVLLNLLLPTVIRKVAGAYDMDCSFGRIELSMLDGNAHIWNLTLRSKATGEPIVDTDYIQGDISILALLRGRLVCYRAEVDGANILIDRAPDGSIPLLKQLAFAGAASRANTPPPKPGDKPQQVSLSAPLRVDAVRLSHVTARLRDRSVSPVFEATVRTNIRLSDVGSGQRPTRFELEVVADPVLDMLLVNGEAHNTPTTLAANVNVELRGLHPKPAAAYLSPLGLKPVADNITLRARLDLQATAIPNSSDLSADVKLDAVSAQVDGEEWAALDSLTLDVKRANPTSAELGKLIIEGGRASMRRTAAGGVRIAGLELAPPTATSTKETVSQPSSIPDFRITLDELDLRHLLANFDDQGVSPAAAIAARLDDMAIKNVVFDPAHPDEKISINGSASIPGLIAAVRLSGSATPFAAKKHLALKVDADGIKPDAITPYLALVGLESELKSGRFTGDLDATAEVDPNGALTANVNASGVSFSDGQNELLAVDTAAIERLGINPKTGAIKVVAIQIKGPAIMIRRESSGSLAALGLRTRTHSPTRTAANAQTAGATPVNAPATQPTLAAIPRIEIGRFSWNQIKLQFADEMVESGQTMAVGDAGVELSDLVIDLQSKSPAAPGKFSAWISMPMVADRLALEGTLTPGAESLAIETSITGNGITAKAVAPYLKTFGIVPKLNAGQLKGNVKANVSVVDANLAASLDVANLVYSDGQTELAGVDAAHVSNVTIKPSGIEIGQVQVDRPRASLARNADGSFEAGGLRFVTVAPTTQAVAVARIAAEKSSGSFALPPAPIHVSLNGLHLKDGSIAWVDRAMAAPVNMTVVASADINNVVVGRPAAPPATINATARISGVLDSAAVSGAIGVSPEAPSVKLDIVADGIRAGDLAAYLPPGIVSTLKSGHFSGSIDAGVSNNPAGGVAAHLVAGNIDLSDGAPLLKLDSLKVTASRIDPDGGAIAIDEISSAGLQTDVALGADGSIGAAGIRLIAAAPATQPAQIAASALPPSTVNASTQPVTDVVALVAAARKPLPLLSIQTLNLGARRLTVAGLNGSQGAPVSLDNVLVHNLNPIEIGGADAESRPPVTIDMDGAIAPLAGGFKVNLRVNPMAQTPNLRLDIAASDISGKGLTDLVPQLKPTIDGSGLTHGAFRAQLNASVNYARRGSRDLDVMRGFTLDFHAKPIEFRSAPDGPVIGGLEEIRSDGIKVEPTTGSVRIRSIEITKPIGRIARDKQGIRALGVLIPLESTPAGPTTQPAPANAQPAVASAQAQPAPSPTQRRTSVIRLDHLTVSGADIIAEDQTSSPPTVFPINGLDVDVRDISNQMPYDGRPMRFSLLATSDKIPLPLRTKGNTSGPTTQNADGSYSEMRELFSQVTAGGVVGIKKSGDHFALDGWAKTAVTGFELLGVRGVARQYEVNIGGGIFDDNNDIRFNPAGNIETRNRVVVTNLSLSEPPNGPIQKALNITAPIDVAIGFITDPDGSITLNLPVPVKNGAINTGDVVGPALGAVSGVLVTAIASAPVKAVGGIGNILGLGPKKGPAAEQLVVIRFLPGYAGLDSAGAASLDALVKRMRKDPNLELQIRPGLSAADVARAHLRANPQPADARSLAEQLRREKAALLAQRAALAGQARGELGSRPESEARSTLALLKTIDRQIAQTENSLDQLYDLLRPGADRRADRRTRAAGLEIAKQRLAGVHAELLAGAVKGADQRIHLTNPQFTPNDSEEGGEISITVVSKKK